MDVLQQESDLASGINFIREGAKVGVINGAIALALLFGSYYMGLDTFVSVQFIERFLPYMIIILIVYGLQLRRRNGGLLAFKEALQFTFVSYVVAAVIIAIGTYVLFNLVDKDLTRKAFEASIERSRQLMERMGGDTAVIDKEVQRAGGTPKDTTIGTIFLGTGQSLIFSFMKSLLISLVIRRERRPI